MNAPDYLALFNNDESKEHGIYCMELGEEDILVDGFAPSKE